MAVWCVQGLDAILITSWILTEVFKVTSIVFDRSSALFVLALAA